MNLEQFPTVWSVLGWGEAEFTTFTSCIILPRMRLTKQSIPFSLPDLIPVGAAWDSLVWGCHTVQHPWEHHCWISACWGEDRPLQLEDGCSPCTFFHQFLGIFPTHLKCCLALSSVTFPFPGRPRCGSGLAAASLIASFEQVVMEYRKLWWPSCISPVPLSHWIWRFPATPGHLPFIS